MSIIGENTMAQRYDLIKWKTIKVDDEEKHLAFKVGSAYQTEKGSIQCDLPDGVSLSGQFTVSPWKDREN